MDLIFQLRYLVRRQFKKGKNLSDNAVVICLCYMMSVVMLNDVITNVTASMLPLQNNPWFDGPLLESICSNSTLSNNFYFNVIAIKPNTMITNAIRPNANLAINIRTYGIMTNAIGPNAFRTKKYTWNHQHWIKCH
jgi:hypothetical protein